MAAPPQPTAVPPIVGLLVRILTFVCLIISTVILATNKITILASVEDYGDYVVTTKHSLKFNIFYAYRYLLACSVIGMAYALLQIVLSVVHVSTGKRVADFLEQFDFYVDLIMSNLLASGAAASFGLTVDLKRTGFDSSNNFFDKIYAAASLCLLGFVFTAVSTVISHLNGSRRT